VKQKVDVLFPEEQIAGRITELGAEIAAAYDGREPCVLGLVKGGLVFLTDLVRRIPLDLTFHLVHVSANRETRAGAVRTEILYSTDFPLEGRDVLLVEDVVDTGITLSYLMGHIHELRPRSLRICALIDKPGERRIDVHPDWAAFSLREPPPGRFLVGYGLGWQDHFRALPYVGTIPQPSAD
jgi:hypoxanthine phosphoribosyltransferase